MRLRLLRACSRLAYRVRGLARLAEVHRRWWARRPRTVWIDDFDGDLVFRCELGEHMGSQIFWRGSYSWPLLRHLATRLEPEMVFVDAGANHGELTLFAAKRLVRGRVIAFEPSQAIFERLEANLAANPTLRAELVPMGLSDAPGHAVLHASAARFEDGTEHHGLPSMYPIDSSFAPTHAIELVTLDGYLAAHPVERLDWLKVDVEGAELALLRGAAATIARWRPRILIEVNEATARAAGGSAREVVEWLVASGYDLFELDDYGCAAPLAISDVRGFHNVLAAPRPSPVR